MQEYLWVVPALHCTKGAEARDQFTVNPVDSLLHNFWVGDYLKSVCSEEEAVRLYCPLQAICQGGDFKITKQISNSRAVPSSRVRIKERVKSPTRRNILTQLWALSMTRWTLWHLCSWHREASESSAEGSQALWLVFVKHSAWLAGRHLYPQVFEASRFLGDRQPIPPLCRH